MKTTRTLLSGLLTAVVMLPVHAEITRNTGGITGGTMKGGVTQGTVKGGVSRGLPSVTADGMSGVNAGIRREPGVLKRLPSIQADTARNPTIDSRPTVTPNALPIPDRTVREDAMKGTDGNAADLFRDADRLNRTTDR